MKMAIAVLHLAVRSRSFSRMHSRLHFAFARRLHSAGLMAASSFCFSEFCPFRFHRFQFPEQSFLPPQTQAHVDSTAPHRFGPRFMCYQAFRWRSLESKWIANSHLFQRVHALGLSTMSERQKEKEKKKRKKKSKRGIIKKLKQIRYITKIKKANMDHEQKLLARIERAKKKIDSLQEVLKDYELPPLPPPKHDPESLTAEELHYLKRLGYKHKNYMILGVRGVFGGVVLNMHLHWKKHQLVKVKCRNFTKEQIHETGTQLARLSGGIVVDVQKGDTIVMYRGRNYKRPEELTPKNTLSKRKALFKAKFEQSLESTKKNIRTLERELALYREHKAKEEAGLFSPKPAESYLSSWSDTEEEEVARPSVCHSESEDIDVDPGLVCDSDSVLETDSDSDSEMNSDQTLDSHEVLDSETESDFEEYSLSDEQRS